MKRREDMDRLVTIRPSKEDFIELDEDRCAGCAKCAMVCPASLWKMRAKKAFLARDYWARCMECAGCFQICPEGAIRFRFPRGGLGVVVAQG